MTFNSLPAYINFVSPTQINILVPATTAFADVVVTNNGAVGTFTVSGSTYGPAFFQWPNSQAVATRQDYSYAVKAGTFSGLNTTAAKPGDVIILWGTGFGPTTPTVPQGVVTPSDQTYSTSAAPTVTLNNVPCTVYGTALASGYAGLYQVAIQVPTSMPNGDWPLVATIGGVASPSNMILSVQQ